MGYIILFIFVIGLVCFALVAASPFLLMFAIGVLIVSFIIGIVQGMRRYYQALVEVYGNAWGIAIGIVLTCLWLAVMIWIGWLVIEALTHIQYA